MARFKLLEGDETVNWMPSSGNSYTGVDGVFLIPDECGEDIEEAKECGLFEEIPEDDRLGGSVGADNPLESNP